MLVYQRVEKQNPTRIVMSSFSIFSSVLYKYIKILHMHMEVEVIDLADFPAGNIWKPRLWNLLRNRWHIPDFGQKTKQKQWTLCRKMKSDALQEKLFPFLVEGGQQKNNIH